MLGKKEPQPSFGDLQIEQRLSPGHFLRQIDNQMDWQPFAALLQELYPSHRGRPSYPPVVLFKALLLQQWYGLSDPGLEEAIRDRLSFQRFLGLSLHDPVPDETTICRFRGLLAKKAMGERLLALLEEQLDSKGLLVKRGSLVDATLLKAQIRPPRKGEASSDPDANWVRKGKDGHFGYKGHLTVDQGSGLVRQIKLTEASHAETLLLEEMLMGDEAAVFADKAYAKGCRRVDLPKQGIFCGIMHKATPGHPLSPWQQWLNRWWARSGGRASNRDPRAPLWYRTNAIYRPSSQLVPLDPGGHGLQPQTDAGTATGGLTPTSIPKFQEIGQDVKISQVRTISARRTFNGESKI
jgi:IS5 family transposase